MLTAAVKKNLFWMREFCLPKFLLVFLSAFVFTELPAPAQKASQENIIRFSLWAEKDAYPGIFDESEKTQSAAQTQTAESLAGENFYSLPIAKIKETAPFILTGMVYGWKTVYVPYDKARRVDEYFEFSPVNELSEAEINSIRYLSPWQEDSRICCWIEFTRTEAQKNLFSSWKTAKNHKVRGTGYGFLSEGFAGIEKACAEAMKNAVREHWRGIIKNKPKEIEARLILCEPPLIGIESGRYKVTLDFFMETDRIVEYRFF